MLVAWTFSLSQHSNLKQNNLLAIKLQLLKTAWWVWGRSHTCILATWAFCISFVASAASEASTRNVTTTASSLLLASLTVPSFTSSRAIPRLSAYAATRRASTSAVTWDGELMPLMVMDTIKTGPSEMKNLCDVMSLPVLRPWHKTPRICVMRNAEANHYVRMCTWPSFSSADIHSKTGS